MSPLDLLWQLHNNPGEQLAALAALDIGFDEGQHLQMQLLDRWLNQGEELGGWKIGMTSGASRNAMGEGIRPFGFVLKSRIIASAKTLPLKMLHRGQVENELCFLMGTSIATHATAETSFNAVHSILPGFEINQKRLSPDAIPGLRVADNLSQWGIVIGEESTPQRDLSNLKVTLKELTKPSQTERTERIIEDVSSIGHIDDHYESLAILSNRLLEFGHKLAAGQYVITGAYGKTPFAAGHFAGDFDSGIGRVEVILA